MRATQRLELQSQSKTQQCTSWRWSGGGGSGFSGFAGSDLEQPVDRNVNTDSESYVLDSESYGTEV